MLKKKENILRFHKKESKILIKTMEQFFYQFWEKFD